MSSARQFDQSPTRQFVQSPGRQRNRGVGVFPRALITVEALQEFLGYLPFNATGLRMEETRYLHYLRVVQLDYFGDTRRRETEFILDRFSGAPTFFEDRGRTEIGDWGIIPRLSHSVSATEIADTYWDGSVTVGTDTSQLTEPWTITECEAAAEVALSAIEGPGNYTMIGGTFHYGFDPVTGSPVPHNPFPIVRMSSLGVEIYSLFPSLDPPVPQSQRYISWGPTLVADQQSSVVHLKKGSYRTPDGMNEIVEDWVGNFNDVDSQHWKSETPAVNPTRWGRRTSAPGIYLFPVPPRGVYERHSFFGLRLPGT